MRLTPAQQEAAWWIRAMNFIRKKTGQLYPEQLKELTNRFECPDDLKSRLDNLNDEDLLSYFNNEGPMNASVNHMLSYKSSCGIIEIKYSINDNKSYPCNTARIPRRKPRLHRRKLRKYKGDFLKQDTITHSIFTLPRSRIILDRLIEYFYGKFSSIINLETNDECLEFNRYLYEAPPAYNLLSINDFSFETQKKTAIDKIVYSFQRLNEAALKGDETERNNIIDKLKTCNFLIEDSKEKTIRIDFSKLRSQGCSYAHIHDFDLSTIMDCFANYTIQSIKAEKTVFYGHTSFSAKNPSKYYIHESINFKCATFMELVEFKYLNFQCENKFKVVDFREACFLGSIRLQDCSFSNSGSASEISFEDAKICRLLEIKRVHMGNSTLNCFQTIFDERPNCKSLAQFMMCDSDFGSNCSIDFSDSEFRSHEQSNVIFQNIKPMPPAKLLFAPDAHDHCPNVYLRINDCEVEHTLQIRNVMMLSFYKTAVHDNAHIVEAPDWKELSSEYRSNRSFREKSKGLIRTKIPNKLLLAVYNNDNTDCFDNNDNHFESKQQQLEFAKGMDFLMLRENFRSQDLYDAEDMAFILFMEFKPVVDMRTKQDSKAKKCFWTMIYKTLYATGKYGLSPIRSLVSLFILIIGFAFVYSMCGQDAFSIGASLDGQCRGLGKCILFSAGNVLPFVSQFEPFSMCACILSAVESAIGAFLIGFFSVGVMRKLLK